MSWHLVRRWRDKLASAEPPRFTGLSTEGAVAARDAALGALDDGALDTVARVDVRPFESAVFVAARTVFTAPLEWCAVLLGRGTRVVLKMPAGEPGWAPELVETAEACSLPLSWTEDRSVVARHPLVVAMGSDATIAEIRATARADARVLAHGHKFSVCWITKPESWRALAEDLALYDTRGCMSPVVILTPLPLDEALDDLSVAMARLQERYPRGAIAPMEGAAIRARSALARTVGQERTGFGWAIHEVPTQHIEPTPLPRTPTLVSVANLSEAMAALEPHMVSLGTVGTDDAGSAERWLDGGACRVCSVGKMQRPPLVRMHDGQPWLVTTGRAVWSEV